MHAEAVGAGVHRLQRQPAGARPDAPAGLPLLRTNYRFDTHQLTAEDLSDPDIIARFEALPVEALRVYAERVTDDAVRSHVIGLIGMKERANRRFDYLRMVQEAVDGLEGKAVADRTLSDLLLPLLMELSRPSRITWRDDQGGETPGKPFVFKAPGKGAKNIALRLVLDEADPKVRKVAGYFDEPKGEIVVIVRNNPNVKELRDTLFHEGLHLAISIMRSQGKAALGETDPAVEALDRGLNKTKALADLENQLEPVRVEIDESRKQRGVAPLPPAAVRSLIPLLWEEVVVFAETSFFELVRAFGTDETAAPGYMTTESVKMYLEHYGFTSKEDMSALTGKATKRIELLASFINRQIRALLRARGLTNAFIPNPKAPADIIWVNSNELPPGLR